MTFTPQVFLIGAQKAGTTTLAYLLDQHPTIIVSNPKETHFFTHNWHKGFEWYEQTFVNPDKQGDKYCYIDASTSYTMAPIYRGDINHVFSGVPEKIYRVRPDAKFIYLIRDPVDRTYSGYWHSVRTGRENRSFSTVIREKNSPYLEISDYFGQMKLWNQYFDKESFLFVSFEELVKSPQSLCQKCFDFMNLDSTYQVTLDSVKNQSYNPNWVGRKLNKLGVTYPSLSNIKKALPKSIQGYINSIRKTNTKIPSIDHDDKRFLMEYFKKRNDELRKVFQISFDWGY